MAVYKHSKSGLFLMEIILAILFFSVAGVICIQLFAKAHLLSESSRNRTMAVSYGQSAAECFKAAEGALPKVQQQLGGTLVGQTLTLCFDRDWNQINELQTDGFVITLCHAPSDNLSLRRAELRVLETGQQNPLLILPVVSYSPLPNP